MDPSVKLHAYQSYAKRFILERPFCALFLDMGLGKTLTTLAALEELLTRGEVRRVLVVAPLRVARDTWVSEAEKWGFAFPVAPAVGCPSERLRALESDAKVVTLNRENVPWAIAQKTFDSFDMLVVDELSSFKNCQSQRHKALMRVRKQFKRVVGLTGTPMSNGLEDIFSEMQIIDGGERFGRSIGRFRGVFMDPDYRCGGIVYSYKPKPFAFEAVTRMIRDVSVSMKIFDYLPMPELVSVSVPAVPDEKERKTYEKMKRDYALEALDGHELTAGSAAALSNKLLQMANGAVYTDDGVTVCLHRRKLEVLADLIEAAQGQPVLVAYWFRHDLARIEQFLKDLGVICRELSDGESLAAWNAGRVPVGLIHPASAGHGLNLQEGGHHLIWFGLTWSLELYQQTNARLWRQGQKSQTVIIQHIVTRGTMDEQVLKALEAKSQGQERVIAAVKAELARPGLSSCRRKVRESTGEAVK